MREEFTVKEVGLCECLLRLPNKLTEAWIILPDGHVRGQLQTRQTCSGSVYYFLESTWKTSSTQAQNACSIAVAL